MSDGDELLTLAGLHVEIGERTIVSGLDLSVQAGRITALVGESGSGKSISAMSTIGLQPPGARVAGSARLRGDELVGRSAGDLRRIRARRVGTVFQEPGRSLSPVMTVSAVFRDVLAVREDLRGRERVRERTAELLAAVGLPDPGRTAGSYPHELSGGELQRVIIALALAGDPELLIADEPTTALDVTVQRGILELLRRIVAEREVGVLLITHDMGVVGEIADTVVVLKDGAVREAGTLRQVLTDPQDTYTRELLTAVPRLEESVAARAQIVPPEVPEGAPPAVRVEGLSVEYRRRGASHRALDDVSLEIAPGHIHGLVGESGSGKSTWGKAIAGLVPVTAGTVELDGVDPSARGRAERRRTYARLGMVFQDPASSLNPRRTIGWSIAEPLHLAGHAPRGGTEARVREALELVQLPGSYASRLPHELSGGQRQRVSIARALIHGPSLLIADEPTSALDVTIQAHVIDVLREAIAGAELACLFISHDLAVVGSLADHVTVLRQGRVVEQGPTARVLGDPRQEYTRNLLASVPDPERRLHEDDPAPA
ncbi:ATP-binding cassette domain-containing protein [Brachybacterium squillarum]|uniref:ATP-binding cassette domain-containing protein n=1 Tax=Brachybacterium squillarum TaxID=661979 RepID=UPI0002629442|nr:ABC transporter ATP-binding protein [Brachybacterium squillarum]